MTTILRRIVLGLLRVLTIKHVVHGNLRVLLRIRLHQLNESFHGTKTMPLLFSENGPKFPKVFNCSLTKVWSPAVFECHSHRQSRNPRKCKLVFRRQSLPLLIEQPCNATNYPGTSETKHEIRLGIIDPFCKDGHRNLRVCQAHRSIEDNFKFRIEVE